MKPHSRGRKLAWRHRTKNKVQINLVYMSEGTRRPAPDRKKGGSPGSLNVCREPEAVTNVKNWKMGVTTRGREEENRQLVCLAKRKTVMHRPGNGPAFDLRLVNSSTGEGKENGARNTGQILLGKGGRCGGPAKMEMKQFRRKRSRKLEIKRPKVWA